MIMGMFNKQFSSPYSLFSVTVPRTEYVAEDLPQNPDEATVYEIKLVFSEYSSRLDVYLTVRDENNTSLECALDPNSPKRCELTILCYQGDGNVRGGFYSGIGDGERFAEPAIPCPFIFQNEAALPLLFGTRERNGRRIGLHSGIVIGTVPAGLEVPLE